jgi:2,3-bisphosphoglycerate-dependent phosphoglycerate mutase
MELVVIRHALPVRWEPERGYPANPELSEIGHQQAAHLAEYLAVEDITAIYSSPQQRAIETARPLAARLDLPITIVDGVAEYDLHSAWYVPDEELKASNDPRWEEAISGPSPEEILAFRTRVLASMEDIVARHPAEKVAVFCHGGVINAYLMDVLERRNPHVVGFFHPNYTSIHRILVSERGRTCIAMNETAHLRGTGLPLGMHG